MSPVKNHLIERLPRRERLRLLAACEPVELVLNEVLCEADAAQRHVYFPTHGFISLVARVDEHPGLELGMVGREGMVGAQLVLGVARCAHWCKVPGPRGASASRPSWSHWRKAPRCSES